MSTFTYGSPRSTQQWVKPSPWYKRWWRAFTLKIAISLHKTAHKINRAASYALYGD